MVNPVEFEKSLGYLSENPSPDGQMEFVKKVVATRKQNDPNIYDKIIVADNSYAKLMVSISTIIMIIIFLYAYKDREKANPNVMIYGSILSIGLSIASGVSL